MERCSIKPYKGFENYIFISYCREDKKEVFPIIEWMSEAAPLYVLQQRMANMLELEAHEFFQKHVSYLHC